MKIKNPNKEWWLFACLLLMFLAGAGQGRFTHKCPVGGISQTGFYRITLTPQVLSLCREDFADLRIMDDSGRMVPYVLKTDLPVFSSRNFVEFPIVHRETWRDSSTTIEMANQAGHAIPSLLLIMKNSSASRSCSLSGSDDRQHWYIIRENIGLEQANDNTSDSFMQSLSFPLSNYRYFKIVIADRGALPLRILRAGIYASSTTYGKYLQLPPALVKQADSADHHSYLQAIFPQAFLVDRLEVEMHGPDLYKRTLRVSARSQGQTRWLGETEISPQSALISLQTARTDTLLIDIDNKDNQPLQLQSLRVYQLNRYLIAYLQAGRHYALLEGDASLQAPDYDLKYFTDTLRANLPEIQPELPQALGVSPPAAALTSHGATRWLWVVMGAILLLLLVFSYRLLQSLSKKSSDDRL